MEEIVNKVANSSLEVFDLEDYYPKGIERKLIFHNGLSKGFYSKKKTLENTLKITIGRNTQTNMLPLIVALMLLFQLGLPFWLQYN